MHDGADHTEFVTFTTAGQLFGVPIGRVQDVFKPSRITRVPLAGAEIAGVLNLRGRIVTMVDLRRRLDLERGASDRTPSVERSRSTSIASSPLSRPASTGSMGTCWSCSTSTGCSTCARRGWPRDDADVRRESERKQASDRTSTAGASAKPARPAVVRKP